MSAEFEGKPRIRKGMTPQELLEAIQKIQEESLASVGTQGFGEVRALMGSNFIDPQSYQEHFGVKVPVTVPLPKDIMQVLNEDCVIEAGKKVCQTHLLFYLPQKLGAINFTIIKLRKLSEKRGTALGRDKLFLSTSLNLWYDRRPFANTPVSADSWVLIAKNLLPSTKGEFFYSMQPILANDPKYKNYRLPKAIELVTGVVMNYLVNNSKIYSNYSGWCEDFSGTDTCRVFLEGSGSRGFYLSHGKDGVRAEGLGCAVTRRFPSS